MLGNIFVGPFILYLTHKKTGRGWMVNGWKIKRVNPYAPVNLDSVIPMIAVPYKARLPAPEAF